LIPLLQGHTLLQSIDIIAPIFCTKQCNDVTDTTLDEVDRLARQVTGSYGVQDIATLLKKHIQGTPEEEIENLILNNEELRTILNYADIIERKMAEQMIIDTSNNVPQVIEQIEYAHDQVMVKCNYVSQYAAAQKRIWVKSSMTAVRYFVMKGLVPLDLSQQDVAPTDAEGLYRKRFNGSFIPANKTARCPYDLDFCKQVLQHHKIVLHLQDQISKFYLSLILTYRSLSYDLLFSIRKQTFTSNCADTFHVHARETNEGIK
jgi:regulator of replication initiation timing